MRFQKHVALHKNSSNNIVGNHATVSREGGEDLAQSKTGATVVSTLKGENYMAGLTLESKDIDGELGDISNRATDEGRSMGQKEEPFGILKKIPLSNGRCTQFAKAKEGKLSLML